MPSTALVEPNKLVIDTVLELLMDPSFNHSYLYAPEALEAVQEYFVDITGETVSVEEIQAAYIVLFTTTLSVYLADRPQRTKATVNSGWTRMLAKRAAPRRGNLRQRNAAGLVNRAAGGAGAA
ncbi:hypothetical protein JCM8097_003334 [Rhodosporidiobolus ruineniae]